MAELPTSFPQKSIEDLEKGNYEVDIGLWLNDGLTLMMKDLGINIAAALVYTLIVSLTCGLAAIVAGPLFVGFYIIGLRRLKGQTPVFQDMFAGFNLFMPLFLLSMVHMLGIVVGSMLCVIPGIYLAVVWTWSSMLVIDRGMGFWDACGVSMKVVHQKFWQHLALVLILGVINSVAGSVAVGFLFSLPYMYAVYLIGYARIFGLSDSEILGDK